MLSKHFEKVRQKSENYRMVYAFTVSLLFTGIIAGLWVSSMFIPNFNSDSNLANGANVASAVDGTSNAGNTGDAGGSNYLSPTGVVKQEGGNLVDSFWNAMKGIKSNPYMGGQFEVKPDGTSGSENINKLSTTTSSGITVEVDNTNNNVTSNGDVIVPDGSANGGGSVDNMDSEN